MSDTVRPYGLESPDPWNSPGKNTEMGCHALLQGIFPNPEIEPRSPVLREGPLPSEPAGKPYNVVLISAVQQSD